MTYTIIFILILLAVAVYDRTNHKHTIRRNFPVIGRLRYMIEKIGPEIRQYLVAGNREEKPFNRVQRGWIYASAKKENNLSGFGSDADFKQVGHIFLRHAAFPYIDGIFKSTHLPPMNRKTDKMLAIGPNRRYPYRPDSLVNISGMSFGALSGAAVRALNGGALKAGCFQNTGEGGLSDHHKMGGDIVFQIGTGYFGVCDKDGKFSMNALTTLVSTNKSIKMIEIKLSQGAKPGKGGILPAEKMTPEIARVRGIQGGAAAVSPSYHTAFSQNVGGLMEFIEKIAEETGLPVGIKSAVGETNFWYDLFHMMNTSGKGPDFITIDGGEGGTGAAPVSFTDHVSLPLNDALNTVVHIMNNRCLSGSRPAIIASGKLGFPAEAIKAMALGADMINVGREALMSIGCIQAQQCHTNTCPSGVATQNKWLERGLNVVDKAERCANYIIALRKEIVELSNACGHDHPSYFSGKNDVLIQTENGLIPLSKINLIN